MLLQDRAQRVKNSIRKREIQDVVVWKVELDEMSCDHLTDRVRVHESSKEDEGD